MKTKFLLLVITLISVFPEYFLANTPSTKEAFISNISGKVVDSSTGAPLEYVSVAIYKSADSALVAGMVSDDEGNFKISDIDNGDYYLKFSYVGFEKKTIAQHIYFEQKPQNRFGKYLARTCKYRH